MRKNIKYSFLEYVQDVWHYVAPYKATFLFAVFLRATSDIANLYPAYALSRTVSVLSTSFDPTVVSQELFPVFMFWGLTSLYHALTKNTSKYFGNVVAGKGGLDLYKDALSHIFKLDLSWQEKENSGNKMKRIDRGFDAINVTVRRIFNVIIEVIVNFLGIIIVFFTLQVGLSVALILFVVCYFILGTHLLKRAIKQERIVNKAGENLGGITFESLNNIQTIKSLAIDHGVINLIARQLGPFMTKIRKRIYYYQVQHTALLTFETVFGFIAILILANGVVAGLYEISLLILFIGFFGKVRTSSSELTEVVQELSMAKVWLSRTMHILKTEPKIENPRVLKRQVNYPLDWKEIKIRDLSFSYKNQTTLDNISLTIKRGEKVGIVGLSGAGKSTLFKLMLDLYESYKGQILLDNISLKKIKRQSYIDHVSVVLQDTELFDMTLSDNIKIAAAKNNSKENAVLAKVIFMAHLEDVVKTLPDGLDTIVGEKGIKLSGGQRQRVGIARALYREPDILLLDEATSHLDAHSEKEIQKALEGFLHKYTTIVIAHRLSTIMAMDKIMVLEKGAVVEVGNFQELVDKNGVFAKMWQEQKI